MHADKEKKHIFEPALTWFLTGLHIFEPDFKDFGLHFGSLCIVSCGRNIHYNIYKETRWITWRTRSQWSNSKFFGFSLANKKKIIYFFGFFNHYFSKCMMSIASFPMYQPRCFVWMKNNFLRRHNVFCKR